MLQFNLFAQKTIVINEVCPSNSETYHDEEMIYSDWIELHNNTSNAINLKDYKIFDNNDLKLAWKIPDTTIQAGKKIIIFADDKNKISSEKYLISSNGSGCNSGSNLDQFRFQYTEMNGDCEIEARASSMFDYDNDSRTGLMIRESLEPGAKYAALFAGNPDKTLFNILFRQTDNEATSRIDMQSYAYPNTWMKVKKQGDSIGFYYLNDALEWTKIDQVYWSSNNKIYIGISVFSGNINKTVSVLYSDLKINNSPFEIDKLKAIDIGQSFGYSNKWIEYHTNFKLDKAADNVFLWNEKGVLIDTLSWIDANSDYSYGCFPDGSNSRFIFINPSPGYENANPYSNKAVAPWFDLKSGFYNSPIDVKINFSQGLDVYYTLDGSEPSKASLKYNSEIIPISKTSVLRARAFKDNDIPSDIVTSSYIFNETSSLGIVSLVGDSSEFFDAKTGLFAPEMVNYDKEVPVSFEFWDNKDKTLFSAGAGVRLHGGITRNFDQKSLRLYARSKYGNRSFEKDFFGKEYLKTYDKIVLRNGGSDWYRAFIRDEVSAIIAKSLNSIMVNPYKPVITYINGEYWGMYSLRERQDEELLAERYQIPIDNIELIELNEDARYGSSKNWKLLLDTVKILDFSDDKSIEIIEKHVDFENIIDYTCAEMFVGNWDWPWNNLKYWRSIDFDGKWRFIYFDTDWGLGNHGAMPDLNTTTDALNPEKSSYSLLMSSLLKNTNFRNRFLNRFADLMNTVYQPANTLRVIDSVAALISAEIPRQHARWDKSCVNWEGEISRMKDFASNRKLNQFNILDKHFKLDSIVNIKFLQDDYSAGRIKINTIIAPEKLLSAYYFKNIPITITVYPNEGFEFIGWSDSKLGSSSSIVYTPVEDAELRPLFRKIETNKDSLIVINEIMYNPPKLIPSEDWIELYNNTNKDMDLSGWEIKDDDDTHSFKIPSGIKIKARDYFVICRDKQAFKTYYPNVKYFVGNLSFGLGETDMVRLYDKKGKLIDSVSYSDNYPWPEKADGDSSSLELKNPSLSNSNYSNWQASARVMGTPGEQNSTYTGASDMELTFTNINIYPNPIKKDFTIQLDEIYNGHYKVELYNYTGLKVCDLYDGVISNETKQLNLSLPINLDIEKGVYLISLKSQESRSIVKVAIE